MTIDQIRQALKEDPSVLMPFEEEFLMCIHEIDKLRLQAAEEAV